jgi:hypothetical protein
MMTFKEFKQKRLDYKKENESNRSWTVGLENAVDEVTKMMYKKYLNGHTKFAFLK